MTPAALNFTGKPVCESLCAIAGKLVAIIIIATYTLSTRAQGINDTQNAQKSDLKVKVPFAIAVQFKGQRDSPIDPATFKLMYGALKVDITSRVTQFVTVTKDGFSLDNARVPPGRHRLTLQVLDEKQRVAERELRIEVE